MRTFQSLITELGRRNSQEEDGPFGPVFTAASASVPEKSRILILVAGEHSAMICACCNGISQLIRVIKYDTGSDVRLGQPVSPSDRIKDLLARGLIQELKNDAGGESYDGVIILSEKSIHEELQRNVGGRLRHLLIACLPGVPAELTLLSGEDRQQTIQ